MVHILKALFSSLFIFFIYFPTLAFTEENECLDTLSAVFMIDSTGSSGADDMANQKNGISKTLDFFEESPLGLTFGIGHFNTQGILVHGLSTDYKSLRQSLGDIPDKGKGGTNIHTGLTTAGNELQNADSSKARVIMLLTDGKSQSEGKDISIAKSLKGQDIRIYTLHYDYDNNVTGLRLLRQIASRPFALFYQKVYGDIAKSLISLLSSHSCADSPSDECFGNDCRPFVDLDGDGFGDNSRQDDIIPRRPLF